jgi:6-phosphogluconolactonase (cycloisomerase 2 family)
MRAIIVLTGVVALAAASALAAAVPTREIAFVANAEAGTVQLVDVAARKIVRTIDINPAKTTVARAGTPNYAQDTDVSPDGRTLYVSRGYLGDVAAFDIASGALKWRRPLETARADHMTITADGRFLFVSAMADNRVDRIDAASGEITGRLATGVYPHDNKVSKDGRRLYNTSLGVLGTLPLAASAGGGEKPAFERQLTIAEAGTLKVTERIELKEAMRPWVFAPGERVIYAQLSNQHAVVAYDLAARKVVRRLDLPVQPGVTAADWDFEAPHHGLALSEDGRTLCLAGRASDYVALVRAPQLTLIATVKVGDAPGWSEVAEGGRTCLAANSRSHDLSIISIRDRAEVTRIRTDRGPKHITVARIPEAVLGAKR